MKFHILKDNVERLLKPEKQSVHVFQFYTAIQLTFINADLRTHVNDGAVTP